MPSESTELIKFYAGTQLDFDTLASANSILDNYLYFITDTHRIYKGLEDISVDSILVTELPRENVLNYRGKILILRELDSKSDPPRYVYSAWTYNPLYSSDTQEPAFSRIDTPLTSKEVLELYSNNYVPNVLPNDPTYQLNVPVQVKPYTLPERSKLIGIEYGAEVNVQSNWNTTDSTHDSFITNKPIISTAVVETPDESQKALNGVLPTTTAVINYLLPYVNDYELLAKYYVDLVNNHDGTEGYNWQVFTKELKDKLDGIEAEAEVNVQSNWNTTDTSHDSYIKNKPLLKTYNTSTKVWDINAEGTNPDLPTITGLNNKLATYVTDYSLLAKYYVDLVNNHDGAEGYNWQVFTKELKTKLDSIETGAEVNVQADWTYTDSSHDSYIKNKPELHTYNNDSGIWSKTSNQSLSIATTAGVDIRLTDYVHDKTLLEKYYKDLVSTGDSTNTKWAIFYDSLKTKLDGIEVNANKYILPTATSQILGGIKIGSELSISNSIVNLATSGVTAGTYGTDSTDTISPENSINIPSITVTNKGILSKSVNTKISLDPIPTTKYTGVLKGPEKIVIKAQDDKLYYITLSDLANFCRTYSPEEGLAILTTNNLASNGGTIVEYASSSNKTISGNLSGTATYATNLGSSTNSYSKSSLDTELSNKQSLDTGLTSLISAINSDTIGYLDKSAKSTATITTKNWYSITETNNLLSKKANVADASFTGTATWS